MTTLVRASIVVACCGRVLLLREPEDALDAQGLDAFRLALRLHARSCPEVS